MSGMMRMRPNGSLLSVSSPTGTCHHTHFVFDTQYINQARLLTTLNLEIFHWQNTSRGNTTPQKLKNAKSLSDQTKVSCDGFSLNTLKPKDRFPDARGMFSTSIFLPAIAQANHNIQKATGSNREFKIAVYTANVEQVVTSLPVQHCCTLT